MTQATTLTLPEEKRLDLLESIINEGMQTFVHVGNALLEIRDNQLYRQTHSTFEAYCRDRWQMGRAHAYRLMDAAQVAINLSPIGDETPVTESQARPLANLEPDEQREVWQRVVETAPNGKVTAAHVQNTVTEYRNTGAVDQENKEEYLQIDEEDLEDDENLGDDKEYLSAINTEDTFGHVETTKKPHVANNSGNNEWYTPSEYIEAARRVLGRIDLDPASSVLANETIHAVRYFSAMDDGLIQKWIGNVWMNPPYSGDLIGKFTAKLMQSVLAGTVPAAVVLINNATETGWFQELIGIASAVVFPKGRIRYLQPGGLPLATGLQGQAFIYIGPDPNVFLREFEQFGWGAILT